MVLEGKQLIGAQTVASGKETFYSFFPALAQKGDTPFYKATGEEVNTAVEKAATAFAVYRKKTGMEKAHFLERIAEEIKALGDELIETCSRETALPKARLEGERDRTVNQLKLMAALLREGSWAGARIDHADLDRKPLPKPDLRQIQIPLGPVVVFSASNFPFAYSVAGGDTASALAAGCPVIVKGHEAHPATSELTGKAVQKAAVESGMPDGVFSLLQGEGKTVGIQLVEHPLVKAVGFTGSFKGGKAIFDAAQRRPEPIPVYAEMGSTNPVFVLPRAVQERSETIAAGFAASVTLGVGQFCTSPGLLFYKNGTPQFERQLQEKFGGTTGGVMLTEYMREAYNKSVSSRQKIRGLHVLAKGGKVDAANAVDTVLFKTTMPVIRENMELAEELFGPASMIVEATTKEELLEAARNLSGHLTATVHGTPEDLAEYADLLEVLEQKAGRVVINGFPTGVEVGHAIVHGGPFPATTDSRTTSVGSTAIYRFTRPVCYQNYPQELLPPELKDENPLGIWRFVNGQWKGGKGE
jgi:alpha-ketoglutaric semialdehyde dehydrogenase